MVFLHITHGLSPKVIAFVATMMGTGVVAVLLARKRISYLRITGTTFAHNSHTHRALPIIVVPLVLGTCAFIATQHLQSIADIVGVLTFIAGLAYVSLIDIDTHLLPWSDTFLISVVPLSAFVGQSLLQGELMDMVTIAVMSLVCWTVFRLSEYLSRGGIGGGDVVLATSIGAVVGRFGASEILRAFIYSFVIAGVVSLVMLLTKRAHRSSTMAFGPFLALGAVVVLMTSRAVPQPV